MTFVQKLRLAFRQPQMINRNASTKSNGIRKIVANGSHGNVRLQLGKYITETQLQARYEQARSGKIT